MSSADFASVIEFVARHLLGDANKAMSSRAELRFGSKGSVAVQISGDGKGTWYDFEAGQGGGVLDLVMAQKRLPKAEAIRWLTDQSFLPADVSRRHDSSARRRPIPDDAATRAARALDIWKAALDPAGTIVETYLSSRGVRFPGAPVIRFHPECPRKDGPLPAMVALMTDPVTSESCGIHRTFLQPDGSGKAAIPSPKMMLGQMGLVRLVDLEDIGVGLGVAEGIETALTVMQRIGWGPVWAATCSAAIASFPVLRATTLNIFADNDPAGIKAADACADRWNAAGLEVFIHTPPAGEDWDDAAHRLGL